MKRMLLLLSLCFCLNLSTNAQTVVKTVIKKQWVELNAAEQLSYLDQNLKLSADQKARLKPLLEKQNIEASKRNAAYKKTGVLPSDFAQFRKKQDVEVKNILNAEQRYQYSTLRR